MKNFIQRIFICFLFILSASFVFVACAPSNDSDNTQDNTQIEESPESSEDSEDGEEPQDPETVSYSVSYVLNGGENNSDNPTKFDEDTDDITLKAATRVGYEFLGWYTDGLYGVNPENKVEKITKDTKKDLVLNAKWRAFFIPNQGTVTQYAKGLEVLDLLPNTTDSFATQSFTKYSGYVDNPMVVYHEGFEEIEFNTNRLNGVVSISLPSTCKKLEVSSNVKLNAVYLPSWEMFYDLQVMGSLGPFGAGAKELYVAGEKVEHLIIPEGINAINANMFYGISSIKEITIADSVTTIGESAFAHIYELTRINLGTGLTSLDEVNLSCDGLDLYLKNAQSFSRLLGTTNGGELIKGRVFVNNEQLSTLNISSNLVADISDFEGIENIIFEEGVTQVYNLPNFSGYVILPKSVTSLGVSDITDRRFATKNYYFAGSKAEFNAKGIPMTRDINLYYYSDTQPAGDQKGKFWKFGADEKTPERWITSYTALPARISCPNPIDESIPYTINPTEIYYGETYIYLTSEVNFTGNFDLFIKIDEETKIKIATFKSSYYQDVYQIALLSNVEGYTNENGEWIYAQLGGNSVNIIMEEV